MKRLAGGLGTVQARWAAVVLVGGGLGVLLLQVLFSGHDWMSRAQLVLTWLIVTGLAMILVRGVPPRRRRRVLLVLGPGLVLMGVGVWVSGWSLFFAGGGLGWMVAAPIILRGRVQMEYQMAIRHLRRSD